MAVERKNFEYDLTPGGEVNAYVMAHNGDYRTRLIERISYTVDEVKLDEVEGFMVEAHETGVPTRRQAFPKRAFENGRMGFIHFGDPEANETNNGGKR